VIEGLEQAQAHGTDRNPVVCFHAGTKASEGGPVTAGGRVLGVTASAGSMRQARDLATAAALEIRFPGAFLRRDIGHRVLQGG
jgi:phosphoribosylamine--glycine ligase